jgi:hypothetical protein
MHATGRLLLLLLLSAIDAALCICMLYDRTSLRILP